MQGLWLPTVWPGGADGEGRDARGVVPDGAVRRSGRDPGGASRVRACLRSRGGVWCDQTYCSPEYAVAVADQTIDYADATNEQIEQCVKDLANSGGVCQEYGLVCNNCGDRVMNIKGACCLDGAYLPSLNYSWAQSSSSSQSSAASSGSC